ncbi:YHYH protein [uncultured Paraglaciecola sp.]|uniref:YHYH protein n=1 Tax=uncultured Paraglaciecola sp. TaxID=1765024 RepID=UPI0025929EF0|nr:YHYH protein [uncultured Paraglaciecola sp.]
MRILRTNTLVNLVSAMVLLGKPLSVWAHADAAGISKDALVSEPQIVSCELENGDVSKCIKYIVKYLPDNLSIGPFCPQTTAEKGGVWHWDGDETGLYRIDGAFLNMLSEQGYTFFDEKGEVFITDVRTTQPASENTCLQASVDTSVEMTVLLPRIPIKSEKLTKLGTVAKVGLALDGVPIFADAPSVLDTGHMPALDTCGGHVDPGGWYHWHATSTDINSVFKRNAVDAECSLEQNASAMFAYAFDGYPIYGSIDYDGKIPTDLDTCNGHLGPTPDSAEPIYHYHASATFPNLPTCLSGVVAKNNFSTNAAQGIGAEGGKGPRRGGPGHKGGTPPGFEQAANKLGITASELFKVVKKNGGRKLNISAAAKELGISEAALKAALPQPPR